MVKRFMLSCIALVAGGLLVGCEYAAVSGKNHTVNIVFDERGCPTEVDLEDIDASRGDKITWQAVDAAGNSANQLFYLYFNPLKDDPTKSKGRKLVTDIDMFVPLALYEYTIVGRKCKAEPLDPRIRVTN